MPLCCAGPWILSLFLSRPCCSSLLLFVMRLVVCRTFVATARAPHVLICGGASGGGDGGGRSAASRHFHSRRNDDFDQGLTLSGAPSSVIAPPAAPRARALLLPCACPRS
ncbi:hypothetical protein T484DRAFT_1938737, partial [Baffinella frigidus]